MPVGDITVPGQLPPEPTHAQSIGFDPKTDPHRGAKSLVAGGAGTVLGGVGGLLKSLATGGDPLRGTLAGALTLGPLSAGTTAYALSNPIQRGLMFGQAFESGVGGALQNLMSGRSVLEGMAQGAAQSVLEGRGRFTPEEKTSLIQQLTQSVLPSGEGWKKRIKLAADTARKLMGRNPIAALRGLRIMEMVMPDLDSQSAIKTAQGLIESGRLRVPNTRIALAAVGRRIWNRLNMYRQAAPQLEALGRLKRLYAEGKMTAEDVAQRVGLLAGRFGGTSEEIQRMRQFLFEVIGRPVEPRTQLAGMYKKYPEMASLLQKAVARRRGAMA